MSWNELWGCVAELLREPSSHLVSAMQGDKYVPDAAERAVWSVFEQWANTQRKKGAGVIRITRPWTGTAPTYKAARKADPKSAERREKLAALF